MADLIIKPATGDGNKLILQDKAGGAVLTTADSGATLAGGIVTTASIADNAVTLAKMASGTDGNIISYDASGNPVAIATGSDGQVLTSTGAGSPPAFEAAGGSTVIIHIIPLASDQNKSGSGDHTYQTFSITPSNPSSKLYLTHVQHSSQGTGGYANFTMNISSSGSNISNRTDTPTITYDLGGCGSGYKHVRTWKLGVITLDGGAASAVTFTFMINHAHGNNTTQIKGGGTTGREVETTTQIIEIF